jgi:hypothetical protein
MKNQPQATGEFDRQIPSSKPAIAIHDTHWRAAQPHAMLGSLSRVP